MTDTEYTPTFEELRDMVGAASFMLGGRGTDQLYGKFDRALAAHDAELAARVCAEQREADAQIVLDMEQAFRDPRGTMVRKLDAAAAIRETGKR
jgi:hypothetical protein